MRRLLGSAIATVFTGALLAGCGAGTPALITGTINQASFPSPLTHMSVLSSTGARTTINVAPNGAFEARLMPGNAYRFEFLSTNTGALIFPRSSGKIDAAFAVVGTTTLDLGNVKYIGNPKDHTYAFTSTTGSGGTGSSNEVEVDDSATCQTDDAAGSADSSGGDASSGDANSGGDISKSEAETETEKVDSEPAEAAVADHNAPSEAGCANGSGAPPPTK